jgi:ubiquinone/menaquinone biosynthesis C-methylase UbiE
MNLEERRALEVDKYIAIYGAGVRYTINERRREQSILALNELPAIDFAQTLLDVGCGDGAWMCWASDVYGLDCIGVDPVPSLLGGRIQTAVATDLPFENGSFDIVTCLDVMEHLIPEDTIPALNEIWRVARYGAIITVNNNPSHYRGVDDAELHINIKSYDEWDNIFRAVFGSARMMNNSGGNRVFIV